MSEESKTLWAVQRRSDGAWMYCDDDGVVWLHRLARADVYETEMDALNEADYWIGTEDIQLVRLVAEVRGVRAVQP